MQDSRLIKLLKTLQPEELKRLLKFLKSPFYNANPRVVSLYEYLRKDHPDYASARINKERAFSRLFPGRDFDYSTLTNLMSDLSRLVEEYLIVLEYERVDYERERMLTRAFGRRNAYVFFEKSTKQMLSDLEEQPYRDISYYQRSMELMYDYYFHAQTEKYRGNINYPEVMMDQFDQYFALFKMQLALELKTRDKTLSKTYRIKWLEELVLENAAMEVTDHPLPAIYANLNVIFNNLHPDRFHLLQEQFQASLSQIPVGEQVFIFQQLLNYSIRQVNRGNDEFLEETLQLYRLGLRLGFLTENEFMDETRFTNIVNFAGVLKEFDWAVAFIEEYSKFLAENIRENVQRLCYAGLYFQKGAFDETIRCLHDYEFTMVLHQVKARALLIRCWYEAFQVDDAQYDFLLAQIETFEKFLRRNKQISAVRRRSYLNFIKVLRSLMKARLQYNLGEVDSLQLTRLINASPQIVLRGWLEEKIKEIK